MRVSRSQKPFGVSIILRPVEQSSCAHAFIAPLTFSRRSPGRASGSLRFATSPPRLSADGGGGRGIQWVGVIGTEAKPHERRRSRDLQRHDLLFRRRMHAVQAMLPRFDPRRRRQGRETWPSNLSVHQSKTTRLLHQPKHQ